MDTKDLKLDIFTNSSTQCFMRITHIPTGMTVGKDGNDQCNLRKKLMSELEKRLEGKVAHD